MMRYLILIFVLFATPSQAQSPITHDADGLTARIVLSPGPLADPDFAGFVKQEAEDLLELYKDIASETPGQALNLSVVDKDFLVTPRYISILRRIDASDGTLVVEAISQDLANRTLLRLDGLLGTRGGSGALRKIAQHVRGGIVTLAHSGTLPEAWKAKVHGATRPDTAVMQNFTLAPSTQSGLIGGLVFHFSPGEVAPTTTGVVAVVVPASVFAAGLNPLVASLFGGEPVAP